MYHLELTYNNPDRDRVELETDLDFGDDPFALFSASPWEADAADCLATVYCVRDDAGRVHAVGTYTPGPDPLHPDLVVTAGKELRVYRYEDVPPTYREKLVNVTRLPM